MVIAWCVFIILILFLGVLVDLIAQHDGIRERTLTHLDAGTISQADFDAIKAKAVSA